MSEPRARWRDLAPRVASALVMAPLGLLAIWAGGLTWELVLTALALITMLEWASLCGARPKTRLAQASAAALVLALACHIACRMLQNHLALQDFPPGFFAATVPFGVVGLMALWLMPFSRTLALGMAYVGFGWASLLTMREGPGGMGLILFIMIVVWSNDIGAYLAGRLIGGPRLAPALSPGKTWAGAVGGFVVSIACGVAVVAALRPPHPSLPGAAVQAVVLSLAAQAGDLLESALKRHYGKKDSGSLIPGHGGLLDRVDGLLAAATAAMLLTLASYVLFGADAWS
jgi:phosphatidate cytidylyltransferase